MISPSPFLGLLGFQGLPGFLGLLMTFLAGPLSLAFLVLQAFLWPSFLRLPWVLLLPRLPRLSVMASRLSLACSGLAFCCLALACLETRTAPGREDAEDEEEKKDDAEDIPLSKALTARL
jgi:hypothetical protein